MKIYSDKLTAIHLVLACHAAGPPIYLNGYDLKDGPRIRARRFESVTIRARSELRTDDDWKSEVRGGLGGNRAMPQYATYDEHGRFMNALFERDPATRIVLAVNTFDGADDFHAQTGGKYRTAESNRQRTTRMRREFLEQDARAEAARFQLSLEQAR